MTVEELEQRVIMLERELAELKQAIAPTPTKEEPAWLRTFGMFADDPGFDEVIRLGREYRQSQREEI